MFFVFCSNVGSRFSPQVSRLTFPLEMGGTKEASVIAKTRGLRIHHEAESDGDRLKRMNRAQAVSS